MKANSSTCICHVHVNNGCQQRQLRRLLFVWFSNRNWNPRKDQLRSLSMGTNYSFTRLSQRVIIIRMAKQSDTPTQVIAQIDTERREYTATHRDGFLNRSPFDSYLSFSLLSYDIVPVNIHADPIIDTHRTSARIERKKIQTGWPSDSKRVRGSFDEGRSPLPPI